MTFNWKLSLLLSLLLFYHLHSYFLSHLLFMLGSSQHLLKVLPALALFASSVFSTQQPEKILLKSRSAVTWSKPSKGFPIHLEDKPKDSRWPPRPYMPQYLISYLSFPYSLFSRNTGLPAVCRIVQAPLTSKPVDAVISA